MVRIALAQINTTVGDLAGNRARILEYIARAQRKGADIVVFPELAISGYPPEDLLFKEHFVQDNSTSLRALEKSVKDIIVIVGFIDQDAQGKLFNAAAVIAKGKVAGVYHKHALPNYGVFDEKRYFHEGTVNPLFSLNGVQFGVGICEDLWHKNGAHEAQIRNGAHVLINISSSPYDFGKTEQREQLLRALAKKGKAFVCYANLIGGQDELVFDGSSTIVNPQGEIIAAGKQFEEDLIVADIPVTATAKKGSAKLVVLPKVNKRKSVAIKQSIPHKLSPIERVFKALVLGTRDYVYKNGFKKVVVGLSGGIDSSTVAVVATEAVGKENVIGVSMPSSVTSKETQMDAQILAEKLGIQFVKIPIHEIFDAYVKTLHEKCTNTEPGVTEENLQARIRGNILMAFSNKFGWLVLTTGNKSEVAVGYCTLYGDLSGGFAVLKDVPKTMVYEIARLINMKKNGVIQESILTRAPTAELRRDQKDQDTLPPYEILDPILKAYVEDHKSVAQIKSINANKALIKNIMSMVDTSEYKRRQSPPGIKITPRAFGKDWRLPITNRYKEF